MKNYIKTLAMLFATVVLSNCNSPKSEAEVAEISSAPSPQQATETRIVEGTVAEIRNRKDGYTAVVVTSSKENFEVLVSRANLKNPTQYRTYKMNEFITVTGDYWKVDKQNHLTVRVIQ